MVRLFWEWFKKQAPEIALDVSNPMHAHQIDQMVATLGGALSWEIGPGTLAPWFFCLSPSGDPQLLHLTRAITSMAPPIDGWEVLPARPPKQIERLQFFWEAAGQRVEVDAESWRAVLYAFPDGDFDVVVATGSLSEVLEEERDHLVYFAVEMIVGEELLLERVRVVEGVHSHDPAVARKAISLRELPLALARKGDR